MISIVKGKREEQRMSVYSIKDLENLSGIKAHTIRIWEKRYSLIAPLRTKTNIRYYTDQELKKILNIAVLNRQGIKISNIAKLSENEIKDEVKHLSSDACNYENVLDSLIVAMIDLNESNFNALLKRSMDKADFKEIMIKLLLPFLEKVGVLWQIGDVNPAQEHFVSNIIRQKILFATEMLPQKAPEAVEETFPYETNTTVTSLNDYNLQNKSLPRPAKGIPYVQQENEIKTKKRFLLFLPEGEWHELGLLFAQYLIKKAGHDVLYMGQNLPYSEVLACGTKVDFDYVLVATTVLHSEIDIKQYLLDLGGAFSKKEIWFFSKIDAEGLDGLGNQFRRIQDMDNLEKLL